MIPFRSLLSGGLLFVLLSQSASQAQDQQTAERDLPEKSPAAKTPEQIDWSKQPFLGKGFVTAVIAGRDGSVWAGDEENSLFRIGPGGAKRVAGPSDAYCYAMAEDAHGRLWVGTGRHGVAVRDETGWRMIDPSCGLGGWHVYSILAASDGSVWVGTEVGVSQIKPDGTIRTLLEDDGLPFNQIVKMAEDREGRIWFAGYLGGAARMDALGAIRPIPKYRLVSDELNDLCLNRAGKVWLCGRGGVTVFDPGRWQSTTWLVPKDSKLADRKEIVKILPDRRITTVCPKDADHIYLGTWRSGLWVLETEKQKLRKVKNVKQDFIYRLVPDPSGGVLVSSYGGGLMGVPGEPLDTEPQAPSQDDPPPKIPLEKITPLASGVARPASRLFKNRLATIAKTPPPPDNPESPGNPLVSPDAAQAIYLGEDWVTIGDWIGNYGNWAYVLCAMNCPFDKHGSAIWAGIDCDPYIGEHTKKFKVTQGEYFGTYLARIKGMKPPPPPPEPVDDSLRNWLHWLYTDNPKVLRLPPKDRSANKPKNRRHAEWDDHAEAYPHTWSGPHIYIDLALNGCDSRHDDIYVLSLYFMNKDGHKSKNRFRDYRITVKPLVQPWEHKSEGWEKRFEQLKTLATARVHDFRGGVYQRFLIREGRYTIQLHKSGSFNTTIAGVFLDKVEGHGRVKPTFDVARDPAHHKP